MQTKLLHAGGYFDETDSESWIVWFLIIAILLLFIFYHYWLHLIINYIINYTYIILVFLFLFDLFYNDIYDINLILRFNSSIIFPCLIRTHHCRILLDIFMSLTFWLNLWLINYYSFVFYFSVCRFIYTYIHRV